jgi:sulfopyruvate decarboxylase subunit alpha
MRAVEFCNALKHQRFNFFVGVPDTILKGVIEVLSADSEVRYIAATREEEAIGIAVGASLGGQRPAVLMQNSGLGNSIGALTSLPLLYKIPLLLLISWRGYRGKDAPEHFVIGKCTVNLLKDVGIAAETLTNRNYDEAITRVVRVIQKRQVPAAILIKEGVIS